MQLKKFLKKFISSDTVNPLLTPPSRPFRGTVVSVLLKELEYKVKSSSKGRLEVMRPKSKSKSELPIKNTETNHSGSVQLKFYNHD